ncbi:MAG: PepSY domain-containing protein [Betaproteobacteria bacterium]
MNRDFHGSRHREGLRLRLRVLHRWCGLVSAVGILWLALTGMPLFASDYFELARRPVPARLQQALYGIDAAPSVSVVQAGHSFAGTDMNWSFDGIEIVDAPGAPLALRAHGEHLFAIGTRGVVLLSPRGEVIERIGTDSIPLGELDATGTDAKGAICLRDRSGSSRCTIDGIDWSPPSPGDIAWAIAGGAAHASISFERFFQDLHALRFLGWGGPLLGIVFGLALSFLASSGLVVTLTRHRHHR